MNMKYAYFRATIHLNGLVVFVCGKSTCAL